MPSICVFDHIPKTGGTSFHSSYLPAAFDDGEAFVLRGAEPGNSEDLTHLAELQSAAREKLRVIAGHNAGQLRSVFSDARYITLVRDPVHRVLSFYRHAREHPDAWEIIGKEMVENNVGLGEFVEKDLFARASGDFASVRDAQAKVVLGPRFPGSDRCEIEDLRRFIEDRFFLIGHTERLEDFLFLLHLLTGFPLALFNNRLVRGRQEPSPEEIESVQRHNAGDRRIYDLVKEEFERRWSAHLTPQAARQYEGYMEALRRFRSATAGDENRTERYPLANLST